MFKKIFAKLKFSQALFEKYHHLFNWCLKLKMNFKVAKFNLLKKQADLKANCTRL